MSNAPIRHIRVFGRGSGRNLYWFLLSLMCVNICIGQQQTDSTKKMYPYKNVIRYNLSGALIFGFDKYIVLGYERVIAPHQSISVNFGRGSLPKMITVSTDSFEVSSDKKNSGFNGSVDYRFYLAKENKYLAPHGVYIGPYYFYSKYIRDNQWKYQNSSANSFVNTHTEFSIHMVGAEAGYQFVLWKRLTVDMVMVGPAVGFYNVKTTFDGNLDAATQKQLFDGLEQLLSQKFPGMNYFFADKEINGNGTLRTAALGYRYLVHIGFNF